MKTIVLAPRPLEVFAPTTLTRFNPDVHSHPHHPVKAHIF
jgi:hypothetical protein